MNFSFHCFRSYAFNRIATGDCEAGDTELVTDTITESSELFQKILCQE